MMLAEQYTGLAARMRREDEKADVTIYGELYTRVTLLAQRLNMSRGDLLWDMLYYAVGERCKDGTDYKAMNAEFKAAGLPYEGFSRTLVRIPAKAVLGHLRMRMEGFDSGEAISGLLLFALGTRYLKQEAEEDRVAAREQAEKSEKDCKDRSFANWKASISGLTKDVLEAVAERLALPHAERENEMQFRVLHYDSADAVRKAAGFRLIMGVLASKHGFRFSYENKEALGGWGSSSDPYVVLRIEFERPAEALDADKAAVVDELKAQIAAS